MVTYVILDYQELVDPGQIFFAWLYGKLSVAAVLTLRYRCDRKGVS